MGAVRRPALTALLLALSAGGVLAARAAPAAAEKASGQLLPGTTCPAFPADNVWNTPVSALPMDAHSSTWLAHMSTASMFLHPDYGPGGGASPYGIPWQITPPHPSFLRLRFLYADESDRGPYPFSARTAIEGGSSSTGDRHALMVDPSSCTLYELYDAHFRSGGRSTAGSGAVWSLRSNHLRASGWTSADAAGLPILPGLVDYDEVRSGHIDHAIRFTAQTTSTRFLWPARHQAGATGDHNYPPMGARFRLKAGFRLPASRCFRACQVYQGDEDLWADPCRQRQQLVLPGHGRSRWTYAMVDQLKAIPARDFQAVDESCLMISPNSGQARQPGTPAYLRACRRT